MSLFFETSVQGQMFLICISVGFLMAMLLDCKSNGGPLRFFIDFSVLTTCAIVLLLMMIDFREKALREYHVLGIISGSILYLSGVGRLKKRMHHWIRQILLHSAGRKND